MIGYLPLQVPVASWFDDMNDRELLDLIPLLENLSTVDSVYELLEEANNQSTQEQQNSFNKKPPMPSTAAPASPPPQTTTQAAVS